MPLKRVRREVCSLIPGKKKVLPRGSPVPSQSVPSGSKSCLTVLKAASQSLLLSPRLQVKFVPELKSIVDMPPTGKKRVQETFVLSRDAKPQPPEAPQRLLSSKGTKKVQESPAAFEARTGLKVSSLTNLNTTASAHSDKKKTKQIKCTLRRDQPKSASEPKLPVNNNGNIKDSNRESEDSENEDDFDKKFHNDYNFVVAKCVVRRKIGFNIDKNSHVSGFRKKMVRVLEQADIMKLRSALAGDTVVVPKHFKLPEEDLKPTRLESNDIDSVPRNVDPSTLLDSNGNSPNLSVDQDEVRLPEDRPDNMPVISCMESLDKIRDKEGEQKKKTTSAAKRNNQLLERKFFSSKPIPPPMIPRDHSKSFQGKIPKQKACKPKWERNGKLWTWALTVDKNGQFSR